MSAWRLRRRPVSRLARPGRTRRPAGQPAPARPRLEVWKLGGASLADASAVRRAVGLVQRHSGDLIVVVSALKGVTDGLLEGAHRSASGDVAAASAQAAAFLRRHRALVLDLVAPGPDRRRLLSEANRAAREYREICRALAALGHLSPRTSDVLVSRGERVPAAPAHVADARLIPQLHYREAAEVAYFGAKVLHPRALIPLDGSRVRLHVRSFLCPEAPGTEVSARRTLSRYPVKGLAVEASQALVTVAGKGMMGVPGIAARTFGALHGEGISVSTIFQASSENSIGFTLSEEDAPRAVEALRRVFKDEIASGLIDGVTARPGVGVGAAVGEGMAGAPGRPAPALT